MTLPKISEFLTSEQESELFLALKIETNEVKSAFWWIKNGTVEILGLGDREGWGGTKEELLVACDASISSAITRISIEKKRIPKKLVLGLPSFWVKDNKVIPEKLDNLHYVIQKLSLNALGFITIPEAICFYLKKQEDELFSGIVIYLGVSEINISLIKEGKVLECQGVGRSDNLALDVEEGILRFSDKDLPPRILLYNSEDLEPARQTLISYPWQPPSETEQKPGFLHLPRVEILPQDFDVKAVAFAGGEEIRKTQKLPSSTPEAIKESEEPEEKVSKKIQFVKEKDIAEELQDFQEPQEEKPSEFKEEAKEEISPQLIIPQKRILPRLKNVLGPFFSSLGLSLKSFFEKLLSVLGGFWGKKNFLFRGILFFTFLLFFFISFYLWAKAEITLIVPSEEKTFQFEFKVDPQADRLDVDQKIIPVRLLGAEANGSKTIQTTGKKTVGEKAKGEVIIYNRTELPKTFLPGSVLIGPGNLKFFLDSEVKVASKTPDLASGIDRWGEVKGSVTASQIGAQYNVAAQSQFYFENLSPSLFLAKNEVAFLGGTSRQISVVSSQDQEGLLRDLFAELREKTKEELEKKPLVEEELISQTVDFKVKFKKFNHEVQDESDSLSLDLSVEGKGLVFKKRDLEELALAVFSPQVSKDMEPERGKTEYNISSILEEKDKFQTTTKIVLRKKVDPKDVIAKVKGLSWVSAEKKLSDLLFVKKAEVKINPGFFFLFKRLPFKPENIKIEVTTD